MQKIRTQEQINKEKRRNQAIIGIVLVLVMILSTAGYALFEGRSSDNTTTGKQKYKGYEFIRTGSFWGLTLENQNFYFQYLPNEVENFSVAGFYSIGDYNGKPLYFVNNNVASQEILNNLQRYVSRYQDACLKGTNCTDSSIPEKNCEDNVIVFENPNSLSTNVSSAILKTSVRKENNCVYISGEFIKGADAFVYRVLGIY